MAQSNKNMKNQKMTNHIPKSKWYPKFVQEAPDLTGKVFVITGTTSGTGFEAAKTVVQKGGTAVCLNRKSQRVVDATAKLMQAVPTAKVVNIECDLQDFDSVKKAVAQVKAKYANNGGIYCIACNAGISMAQDKATKDGCDVQMQTNHLSHFILCAELYPLLSGDDPRIVLHSSEARHMTHKNEGLKQKYFEATNGDGNLGGNGMSMFFGGGCMERYSQSKLANSVMMYALHEKLQAKGSKVKVTCAHPGCSATSLGDGIMYRMPWLDRQILWFLFRFMAQSAEDGALGLLTGMLGTTAESGVLYGPKNGLAGPAVSNPPKPCENDPEAMKLLWGVSEATTGVKFDI